MRLAKSTTKNILIAKVKGLLPQCNYTHFEETKLLPKNQGE